MKCAMLSARDFILHTSRELGGEAPKAHIWRRASRRLYGAVGGEGKYARMTKCTSGHRVKAWK